MDMAPSDGSVSMLLAQIKDRDPAALKPLWDRYFTRLVALAREQLRGAPRAAADEEDVALEAFNSFYRAASAGRFPRLDDRDDLWHVLFVLTTRKAIGLVRHETCQKRVPKPAIVAAEPSAAEAAEVAEACDRLLGVLGNTTLRAVAVGKMEGYTNAEIADRIGYSVPTVERKLAAIRDIWEREGLR